MGKSEVTIYTDGGANPNPGLGGWGALLVYGKHRKELSGTEHNTTNNRMEITAAIKALESLNRPCTVQLHTDSQYLHHGITDWLEKWVKNNWRTANRQPVKNQDLWKRLLELSQKHEIHWHWVKGHAGDESNERAHKLVIEAREKTAT